MSSLGTPVDNNFTSTEANGAGTGISTTNNYATEFMVSAMPLYNAGLPTSGRYYMGDLNITFSTPLTDPMIQLVGIGATTGSLGFTSEFDCQTPGVTLTKMSGCAELSVTGNNIVNTATHPNSNTGAGAATGSILVKGTNIASLKFKVYVKGDGGSSAWATSSSHSGDQMLIAVSSAIPTLVLPITLNNFTAIPQSGGALLQWLTGTENNTNFFDLQWSTDEETWQSIGAVTAAGFSNTEKKYSFVHSSPAPGANYYRLRVVSRDNGSAWSPVVELSYAAVTRLMGYPNPTKGDFTITGITSPFVSVTVMSLDGKPLQQMENFVAGQSISLSQYPTGIYLISVKENGKTQLLKLFKE
jgi:hypothetical protein